MLEVTSGFGFGVIFGYFVCLLAFDIVQYFKKRHERINH